MTDASEAAVWVWFGANAAAAGCFLLFAPDSPWADPVGGLALGAGFVGVVFGVVLSVLFVAEGSV